MKVLQILKPMVKPFGMFLFAFLMLILLLVTLFHHTSKEFVYNHTGFREIPVSSEEVKAGLIEKKAFTKFLLPVTMNFIREQEDGNYLMTFPILGEERFSVWMSQIEKKALTGRIMRDIRKQGYDIEKLGESSTFIKFNIQSWAFKGYYTYVLSQISPDNTLLTLYSEYRGSYSFVCSIGRFISFIMDGQHDHALDIAKAYTQYSAEKRKENGGDKYIEGKNTGKDLPEGGFEVLDDDNEDL